MRKFLFLLFIPAFFLSAFTFSTQEDKPAVQETIKWITFEEAIKATRENPKKIFIDVYTGWCGWCKVMDKNTFADSAVAAYMNQNFYMVKFDAESKSTVRYNDHDFKFMPEYKSHELAISLLQGQMSYPSYVILNEKEQIQGIEKGYMEKAVFLPKMQTYAAAKVK